jgi:outer membrane protein OmpA-like peptidoglycan-associated protein
MKYLLINALSFSLISGCQADAPSLALSTDPLSAKESSMETMLTPSLHQNDNWSQELAHKSAQHLANVIKKTQNPLNNVTQKPVEELAQTATTNTAKTITAAKTTPDIPPDTSAEVTLHQQEVILPSHQTLSKTLTNPISTPITQQRHLTLTAGSSGQLLDHSIAVPKIEKFVKEMENWPNIQSIHVTGHTDSTGSVNNNRLLAQERATAVQGLLQNAGVSAELIHTHAAGEGQPIADNQTDIGRAKNRRVDIEVRIKNRLQQVTHDVTTPSAGEQDS